MGSGSGWDGGGAAAALAVATRKGAAKIAFTPGTAEFNLPAPLKACW